MLVAGDSVGGCGTLDSDRTFAAVLQEALMAPEALRMLGARYAHVGNVAKSLMDSSGLRIILERILPQYGRLDLIVIVCGQADAVRWLFHGAPDGQAAPPLTEAECFASYPGLQFGWAPRKMAVTALYRRASALLRRTPRELCAGRMNIRDLHDRRKLAAFTPAHPGLFRGSPRVRSKLSGGAPSCPAACRSRDSRRGDGLAEGRVHC